jgi:hypothetical protein
MRELTVFSRQGCHLCELLIEELEPLCRAHGVRLQVRDVDDDDRWRERYGSRVPVLCTADGGELSGWPFDRERVSAWLQYTS